MFSDDFQKHKKKTIISHRIKNRLSQNQPINFFSFLADW